MYADVGQAHLVVHHLLSTKRYRLIWLYNVYSLYFRYSCMELHETWSIIEAIEKRDDAFDQWCLQRILRPEHFLHSWSERVTTAYKYIFVCCGVTIFEVLQ